MPDIISLGSNWQNSQDSFFWKRYYDAFASPLNVNDVMPMDVRNERPLYGRIDGNGDTVYVIPKEDYFRTLLSRRGRPVKVLNFVADAFEELQAEINLKVAKGEMSRRGEYTNVTAEFGYLNSQTYYNDYLDALYLRFTSDYLESEWALAKRVVSFETYMDAFSEFIKREAVRLPFTRTAFLSGNRVPPTVSGLCIETHDRDFSDDFKKHDLFINDPNYGAYKTTARKFGFMIDRHAPWRLIADVTSKYMHKKMFKYGLTSSNLFSQYYVPSYIYDIDVMRVVLYNWYNQYVTSYPNFKKVKITGCQSAIRRNNPDSKHVVAQYTPRQRFNSIEEYDSQFGANYWLRKYLFIRFAELSVSGRYYNFGQIMKKVLTLHRVKGYHIAVKYIHYVTRRFMPNIVYEEGLGKLSGVISTIKTTKKTRPPSTYKYKMQKYKRINEGFDDKANAGKKPLKASPVDDKMKSQKMPYQG